MLLLFLFIYLFLRSLNVLSQQNLFDRGVPETSCATFSTTHEIANSFSKSAEIFVHGLAYSCCWIAGTGRDAKKLIVCDARLCPSENSHLEQEILCMCSAYEL